MKRRLCGFVCSDGTRPKATPRLEHVFLDRFILISSILGCFITIHYRVKWWCGRWLAHMAQICSWLLFPPTGCRPGDSGPKEAGPEAWPNGLLKVEKLRKEKTQQTAESESFFMHFLMICWMFMLCSCSSLYCLFVSLYFLLFLLLLDSWWLGIPCESFQARWREDWVRVETVTISTGEGGLYMAPGQPRLFFWLHF